MMKFCQESIFKPQKKLYKEKNNITNGFLMSIMALIWKIFTKEKLDYTAKNGDKVF